MFKQSLLAGAVLAVSQAASAAFVIDNFNLPTTGVQRVCDARATPTDCPASAFQASRYTDPAHTAATPSGNIFGGSRDLFIDAPNQGDSAAPYFTRVENGRLSVSTPTASANPPAFPGANVWTSIVRWDGGNSDPGAGDDVVDTFTPESGGGFFDTFGITRAGIAASDLTSGGTNVGFAATITGSDGPFSFELQVFSGAGRWTSLILGATEVGNCGSQVIPDCFPAPYTLNIGFNQFQTLSGFAVQGGQNFGGGADFTAITAAQIIFRGTESVDFTLDMIQAVPEPTSLALVGLGLLGAGLARRRMMKA